MEIELTTREWNIVEKKVKFNLPVEPSYYFITGERKSYSVKPRLPEWNKNELYEYEIVRVGLSSECEIEKFSVRVSDIPEILNKPEGHRLKHAYRIIDMVVNHPDDPEFLRTKEEFMGDFNAALIEINNAL